MSQEFPQTATALLLSAIIQSSDDAIVSKDLDGTITSWNPAAERMFGYTAAEAVGRSIRLIIPADRQSEEDEVLRRIRRGLSVDHFETIRVRKDGTFIPISLTISPVRDERGRIIGASKIARDISHRLRIERALADAEATRTDLHERLLSLVAASGSLLGSDSVDDMLPAIVRLAGKTVAADGYALWRREPRTGQWRIASHAGVSEEFVGGMVPETTQADARVLAEPLAADDVDTVPELEGRREALRREGIRSLLAIPLGVSKPLTAALAFYFRERHHFRPIEIETARALANLASAALQTADLHAQQKQREQQALFLARAATALAGSLDYRQTLRTLASLAVPDIADWCAVDMLMHGTLERIALMHHDPARIHQAEEFNRKHPPRREDEGGITGVLRSGQSELVERLTDEAVEAIAESPEHLADIRALRIVSYMIVPLRTRRGTVGAISFVAAESGRHYTASDLRFAETVADRAAVAVENVWAYEEARMANQLKDEFLATLSHELRTPLNAMLGYTRMLKAGAVPAERREAALDVIERNGSTLVQIIEDLLDVSRIISGKLRLEIGSVEADQLLHDAVSTIQPGADAKGIVLQTRTNTPGLVLHADRDRLQQVLWNLLTNAVKFTPSGGRIEVEITAEAGGVQFTVRDTGRGIDAALLPHVFERFRQGDSQVGREHGGLGLGLSIARHIVEMHGGTIYAESEGENKGATFRVRLPSIAVKAG